MVWSGWGSVGSEEWVDIWGCGSMYLFLVTRYCSGLGCRLILLLLMVFSIPWLQHTMYLVIDCDIIHV